jgi:hypothetical protein
MATKTRPKKQATTLPKFQDALELSGKEYNRVRQQAFDYYRIEKKAADLMPDVYAWMKDNGYTKDDIKAVRSRGTDGLHYAGVLAKCLNAGMPDLHPGHKEYWEALDGTNGVVKPVSESLRNLVDAAVEKGEKIVEAEEAKPDAPVKTIQQRTWETAVSMNSALDAEAEKLFADPENYDVKKFSAKTILTKAEAKAGHARLIKEMHLPDLEEMREVLAGTDEQLKEAYAHLSKKAVKNIIAFYEEIDSACGMMQEQQKSQRKPRQKRPQPKDKIVSKLKYMKSFDQLKLVSIDPTKILDAKELWVYNTKTRKLGKYVVDDEFGTGQTLGVKGTTITNFDESKSVQKTLRKPEEQIAEFKGAGKVALRKFIEDIKSVDIKLNGRLNDQTILLKVL